MILDMNRVDDGHEFESVVAVIGSGAVGITLARELEAANVPVHVFESGPEEGDPESQELYQGRNIGLDYFDLDICRLRYFGGSTNHWGGICRPLDAFDFEPRKGIPGSGWPIGRDELTPYYERALPYFGAVAATTNGGPFERWQDTQEGRFLTQIKVEESALRLLVFHYPKPIARFAQLHGEAIRQSANVTLVTNANVTNIALRGSGEAVDRLELRSLQGRRCNARAQYYVLAAGGIENARILLLSNDVQPAGVGNGHDQVGRHFMEHPHIDAGRLVLTTPVDCFEKESFEPATRVGYRFGFRDDVMHENGLLNCYFGSAIPYAKGDQAFRDLVQELRRLEMPEADIAAIFRDGEQVLDVLNCWVRGKRRNYRERELHILMEQAPNPESRVVLSDERDALGQRRANLDWRLGEHEEHTVRRSLELLAAELGRQGIGRVHLPETVSEPGRLQGWPGVEGGHHHMGTTRMSETPTDGVVDRNCRVHGVPNLYIGGGSVFRTSGSSHPTYSVVAFAVRLADEIKRQLKG